MGRFVFLILSVLTLVTQHSGLDIQERLLAPADVKSQGHVFISREQFSELQSRVETTAKVLSIQRLKARIRVYSNVLHLVVSARVLAPEGVKILPREAAVIRHFGKGKLHSGNDGVEFWANEPSNIEVEALMPLGASSGEVDHLMPWALPFPGELSFDADAELLEPRIALFDKQSELFLPVAVSSEGVSAIRIRGRVKGARAAVDPTKVRVTEESIPQPQVFSELAQKFFVSRDETLITVYVQLDISRHPIRELQLRVPEGLEILNIQDATTPATLDPKTHMVRFSREVRNRAGFTLNGRFAHDDKNAGFVYAGLVRTEGTVSEKTWLAVQARDVLRINEAGFEFADRVYRVDVSELPDTLQPHDGEPVLYACRILGDAGSVRIDAELFERIEPKNLLISAFRGSATFHADRSALHQWQYQLEVEREGTYEFALPEGFELRQARLNGREVAVFSGTSGGVAVDLKPSQVLRRGENQSYNLLQSRVITGGLQSQNLSLTLMAPSSPGDQVEIRLPLPEHARNISFTVQTEDGLKLPRVSSTFDNPRWELAEAMNQLGNRTLEKFLVPIAVFLALLAWGRSGLLAKFLVSESSAWQMFRVSLIWILATVWLVSSARIVMSHEEKVPMPSAVYQTVSESLTRSLTPVGEGLNLFSMVGRSDGHRIAVDFSSSLFPLGSGSQILVACVLALILLLIQMRKAESFLFFFSLIILFWLGASLFGQVIQPFAWLWAQPLAIFVAGLLGLFSRARRQLLTCVLLTCLSSSEAIEVFTAMDSNHQPIRFLKDEDYRKLFHPRETATLQEPVYGASQGLLRRESDSFILDMVYSQPASGRLTMAYPALFAQDAILSIVPSPDRLEIQNSGPVMVYETGLPERLAVSFVVTTRARQFLSSGGQIRIQGQSMLSQSIEFDCQTLVIETQALRRPGTCQYYIPALAASTFALKARSVQEEKEEKTVEMLQFQGMQATATHSVSVREGLLDMASTFRLSIDGSLSQAVSLGLPDGLLIKSVQSRQGDLVDWSRPSQGQALLLNFRPGVTGQIEFSLESEKLLSGTSTTLGTFNLAQASQLESLWRFEPEPGLEFRLGLGGELEKLLRQRSTSSSGHEIEELRTSEVRDAFFQLGYSPRESVSTYKALVDLLEMSAYFASDGNLYLRRALVVRNNAEQFLTMKPMPNEELLTARLHNQRAAIGKKGDHWLLPLRMILNSQQEVAPFTLEVTTRMKAPVMGMVNLEPAHLMLPVAQATFQASIHPGARIELSSGRWAPLARGKLPVFQENLPNSWQGRLVQSAADWHPPFQHDQLGRIQWFLTPEPGLSQIQLNLSRRLSPNLLALLVCVLVLMVMVTTRGVRLYLFLLIPWIYTLPVPMIGLCALTACVLALMRFASLPLVLMRSLFTLLCLLMSTSAQTTIMPRVLPWAKVQSMQGMSLVSAARIEEFLRSVATKPAVTESMARMSLDVSEVASHVLDLRIRAEINSSTDKECVPLIPLGWVLPTGDETRWQRHEEGLCIQAAPEAMVVETRARVKLHPKSASLPLPKKAQVTIGSFTSVSGYRLVADAGHALPSPVIVSGVSSLRLELPGPVTPETNEQVATFEQAEPELIRIHDYSLISGSGNHELNMDLHILVSNQAVHALPVPAVQQFRLRQLQVHPRQPFLYKDGILTFPQGVIGQVRIQVSGEIPAGPSALELPPQTLQSVLGGRFQLFVKDNLRITVSENPRLSAILNEEEPLNRQYPMLGSWKFHGAFPGFLARMENLGTYTLATAPVTDVRAQTLILDSERIANSLQASVRVPPTHEMVLTIPQLEHLLGVYINKEPAKAFTNQSGSLVVQFARTLSDAIVQLEIKYLARPGAKFRLELPLEFGSSEVQWQIWHADHLMLKDVQSNLRLLGDQGSDSPVRMLPGTEILTVGLIDGVSAAAQTGILGLLLYLLYLLVSYLYASVKEILAGIRSPVFQLWVRRLVGVGVLGLIAMGSALIVALVFMFSKDFVNEAVPNFRRAREQSIAARKKMESRADMEADAFNMMARDEIEGYALEDGASFGGMAEQSLAKPSRQMNKLRSQLAPGSPPPPPPAPESKESRVQKGNIKPVQVVMPALPRKLELDSRLPLGSPAYVEFKVLSQSDWMTKDWVKTLIIGVICIVAGYALSRGAAFLLAVMLLLAWALPFMDSRLVSLILPLAIAVLLRKRALLCLLLMNFQTGASEVDVYSVWDGAQKSFILTGQFLVADRDLEPRNADSRQEVFCQSIQLKPKSLSGAEWLQVQLVCDSPELASTRSSDMAQPVTRAWLMDTHKNVRVLSSEAGGLELNREDSGYWLTGADLKKNMPATLVIDLQTQAIRENYGDVLRMIMPRPLHARLTIDASAIGYYPELQDGTTDTHITEIPLGRGVFDLRLHRRPVLGGVNSLQRFEAIVDDRRPHFEVQLTYTPSRYGIVASLNISAQATQAVLLHYPQQGKVAKLDVRRGGKSLKQGVDYGLSQEGSNGRLIRWNATREPLDIEISYYLPQAEQGVFLPIQMQSRSTARFQIKAVTQGNALLTLEPSAEALPHLRQSLSSGREGWQILNPPPQLYQMPLFRVNYRDREKANPTASKLIEATMEVRLADAVSMFCTLNFVLQEPEGQFFSLQMPPGAMIHDARVLGRVAKVASEGHQILIPLPPKTDRRPVQISLQYSQPLKQGSAGRYVLGLPGLALSPEIVQVNVYSARELEFEATPMTFRKNSGHWHARRQGGMPDKPVEFRILDKSQVDTKEIDWLSWWPAALSAIAIMAILRMRPKLRVVLLGILCLVMLLWSHPLGALTLGLFLAQFARIPITPKDAAAP